VIVIDTNVVSEITRTRPSVAVRAWLDSQISQDLFLCAPVLAELRYGIERLPKGRRREFLDVALGRIIGEGFPDRILPLDRDAALEFGRVVAHRDRLGRPIATMDGMIAAIAIVNRAAIATRDVEDFTGLGIDVIDPFGASAVE
jgi:predicted nucleic acid-binding protein